MITKEDILRFLENKKEAFSTEYQVTKLGLFGSFAKGEASADSDIDIIIEFRPNTDSLHEKKNQIKRFIKEQFNREVDLCREKYIKPYFKSQILKSAIYV